MRSQTKSLTFAVAVVAVALTLAACGSTPPPKAVVHRADGVALTAPGTKLSFGQSATVTSRTAAGVASPLLITVQRIRTVPVAQLARFGVPSLIPPVTPYYVSVYVKNVGRHQLGGTAIPLYLQDSRNVLVNYNPIKSRFAACPSRGLPARFGPGAVVNTCLLYLLPRTDPATLVSYRPVQTVEPIIWRGPIQHVTAGKRK